MIGSVDAVSALRNRYRSRGTPASGEDERVRFDDSLTTVLAADAATPFGAQSAWRQLVDLIGRRRIDATGPALARLAALREEVPASVRAASGRALALCVPPAELVAFFAHDEMAVAAPVVRTAALAVAEWLTLLPRLTPALRGVLRDRRDLPPEVVRGLASFGATDFVLAHDAPPAEPAPDVMPSAPLSETPFVAVGAVARALPVVAEALRHVAEPVPRFEIADLVARIDAFRRDRELVAPVVSATPAPPLDSFRFETDAGGVIRWVEGVARGPLIGLSLAHAGRHGAVQVDAAVGGALRARAGVRDVRLEIGGASPVAGAWRIAVEPRFDRASGRFVGMNGIARRPGRNESAAPATTASDSLRQLVHELRTPTNAIAGFAELIGSALLGPVPPVYGERAQLIQRQAGELLATIDDLDTAARIEGSALDLRPGTVDLAAVLRQAAAELQPLAAERGATLSADGDSPAGVHGDDRAIERLVTRLLATLVSAAEPGERLRAQLAIRTRVVRLAVTRPRALGDRAEAALLSIDAEAEREGAPLLGTGFTLRLVRNLALELGGRLAIEADRLTLRLPIASAAEVERAAAQ